jgi:hypothetical protein
MLNSAVGAVYFWTDYISYQPENNKTISRLVIVSTCTKCCLRIKTLGSNLFQKMCRKVFGFDSSSVLPQSSAVPEEKGSRTHSRPSALNEIEILKRKKRYFEKGRAVSVTLVNMIHP